MNFEITKLKGNDEACDCAQIMSSTDPWLMLQRDFDQCLSTINNPINEVFVMRVEDEITGFGIINLKGSLVGYIRTIAFKSESRGKGLGTHLIHYLEEIIFKQHPNVFICVSSFNPSARKLYERLGYEYVGELKDFIVVGHSEFLLRKTLGPLANFQPKG